MADHNAVAPRIGLVVRPGESSGYPVAALLADTLADGWDTQVFCDARQPLEPSVIEGLAEEVLCRHVHPPPPGFRRRSPRMDAVIGLARGLGRRPAVTLWQVRPGAGPPHRSLRALVVALGPQLVHLPSGVVAEDWLGIAAALGARTLVSVGSEEASASAYDSPERYRRVWSRADALQVESEALAALVRQQGADAHSVTVIPPAADPLLLDREPAPPPAPAQLRILGVGPLSWTQGYEHALRGVKLLVDRGIACEYRIVGRGEHCDSLAFARHQLGLEGCVEFVEPGSAQQLREHLRWAGVLVNVAILATSPKPTLDAQAAGVPVVTTEPPVPGANTVLAVPARQPQALCDALAALAGNDALRARLVEGGRRQALEAPTPAAQTARFRDLYRDVLADA